VTRQDSTNNYYVADGIGYVGGVRAKNTAIQTVTVSTKPSNIWLDVSLQGDISDLSTVANLVVSASEEIDYTDSNGIRHYLTKIAEIESGGDATDQREIYGINLPLTESPTDARQGRILQTNAHPMVMFIDPYKKSIEHASGGRETVIYDAQGHPNIMCVITRKNYEDLGLDALNLGTGTMTAFLTNGVPRSEILISKYINSTPASGGFASVGGEYPRIGISWKDAKSLCAAKGEGWHLLSQHEWEMLKFLSIASGHAVRGNTDYGRAHDAFFENATRLDGKSAGDRSGDTSGALSKSGQGAVAWSHDGTPFGVFDLVGNVVEFVDL
jgi:hypothetical protein